MNRNPILEFNSEQLNVIQKLIERAIKVEIKKYNYDEAINLITIIKSVDAQRRHMWNNEKFGVYEEMADQVFDVNDIPF